MPHVVITRLTDALNDRERSVKGAKVLVLGVANKRDINDERESPALDIIQLFRDRGANVSYHDPYCPTAELGHGSGDVMHSVPFENLGSYDACVIVTDHRSVDYKRLVAEAKVVVDTRNATKPLRAGAKATIVTI
jgi:UDP-N-acetyl-D-glucosamine dehydrogenase